MTELGTAGNYDELQAILRVRAAALQISREELDRVSGLPKGFCAKVLADPPLRRMGPDSIGPMLWVLGAKLQVIEDPRAVEMFTATADKRVEKYALNAGMHTAAVHFKISLRKLRRAGRKGGKSSRRYLSRKKARKLARKSAWYRWEKPKLVKLARGQISADGCAFCRWTPAIARAMQRGRQMGLTLHSHTKFSPAAATRQQPSQPR